MDRIEALEIKIKELASEIERLKAEKNNESQCDFINGGGVVYTDDFRGALIDKVVYTLGDVFRAEQLKVEAELRRFSSPFNNGEENYIIYFNHHKNMVRIDKSAYLQYSNIHFASPEIAQKAIDTVGEDRIKKYYFGVTE